MQFHSCSQIKGERERGGEGGGGGGGGGLPRTCSVQFSSVQLKNVKQKEAQSVGAESSHTEVN